jgi:hypothetical protein
VQNDVPLISLSPIVAASARGKTCHALRQRLFIPLQRSNVEQHIWQKHPRHHGGDSFLHRYRASAHKTLVAPYVRELSPEPATASTVTSVQLMDPWDTPERHQRRSPECSSTHNYTPLASVECRQQDEQLYSTPLSPPAPALSDFPVQALPSSPYTSSPCPYPGTHTTFLLLARENPRSRFHFRANSAPIT